MGCYHFGTVKALLEEGVLPHIISGACEFFHLDLWFQEDSHLTPHILIVHLFIFTTAVGSVVGAVVCTRNEEELERDLRPEVMEKKLVCFSRSWSDRIKSLCNNGNLFATEDWLELIRW